MVGPLAMALAVMAAQFAQAGTGELRLRVTDQSGSPLQSVVDITSSTNDYRETVDTDEGGTVDVKRLPFGTYGLAVRRDGFATFSGRFEYQTQYVIDGLPLTDNRSPAFAAEVEATDVRGVRATTGGYPAEYGRKHGGVIEVVTLGTARSGLHGSVNTSVGSFSTLDGTAAAEYAWPRAVLGASVGAADTDRYLDPPVEENFTNHATTSHGTIRFERDFSRADRLGVIVRRGQANFLVPNELR